MLWKEFKFFTFQIDIHIHRHRQSDIQIAIHIHISRISFYLLTYLPGEKESKRGIFRF